MNGHQDVLGPPLCVHGVHLGGAPRTRWEALTLVGGLLEERGAVHAGYTDSLVAREQNCSTYLGFGIAVPHALHVHDYLVVREGLLFTRFPVPVRWDGESVSACIAVTAPADRQAEVLCRIAATLLREDNLGTIQSSNDTTEIERVLQAV